MSRIFNASQNIVQPWKNARKTPGLYQANEKTKGGIVSVSEFKAPKWRGGNPKGLLAAKAETWKFADAGGPQLSRKGVHPLSFLNAIYPDARSSVDSYCRRRRPNSMPSKPQS